MGTASSKRNRSSQQKAEATRHAHRVRTEVIAWIGLVASLATLVTLVVTLVQVATADDTTNTEIKEMIISEDATRSEIRKLLDEVKTILNSKTTGISTL